MEKIYLYLSVHELVDFLLRAGDIDSRVYNQETMSLGSKMHAAYQKKAGLAYLSEVPLEATIDRPLGQIHLQGRADGIILGENAPIIDEIKTTVAPLEQFYAEQKRWHQGQALCYAYMFLLDHPYDGATINLTYLSQIDGSKMTKSRYFKKEEIEKEIYSYCDEYLLFQVELRKHKKERDESAKSLPFPYSRFRKGQRELAKYAYGIAKQGGLLFAEAPTGIGKTLSTLYPFVKSFQKDRVDRIFYLTAKNSGSLSALEGVIQLEEKGLKARCSLLLAKEKICFCPGHKCNPDDCPYAKGYYGKLKESLLLAKEEGLCHTPEFISRFALEHMLCPFEFQLDLSLLSDIIIADYNYFYDPIVHLERYFEDDKDQSTFLILNDEAHNLVDRGRSMYSSSLSYLEAISAKKAIKRKNSPVKRALGKLIKAMEAYAPEEDGQMQYETIPLALMKALDSLKTAKQKEEKEGEIEDSAYLSSLSREASRFARLASEYLLPSHRFYFKRRGEEIEAILNCLDASPFIKQSLERVRGALLFSATLSPISYYSEAIIGQKEVPSLMLSSPFPKSNFHLMIAPKVSVRYKDRQNSYQQVSDYLESFVKNKIGNYFFYFPSFEYLDNILPLLEEKLGEIHPQKRKMSPADRDEFLSIFSPNPSKTNIACLVLGGTFSEGINLLSDRLIGVAIVGIGLPQISYENDLIRQYYDEKEGHGFDYAYKDPGINKVMQGVGRLIRSETDVGAALLIDDRYLRNEYKKLFERTWSKYEVVLSPKEVEESLSSFYKGKKL